MLAVSQLAGFMAFPPAAAGVASLVASLQPFEITIPAASASATATISSVNTARAFIVPGGTAYDNSSSAQNNSRASVTLTNATTVTANRTGTTGAVTVRGTVFELTAAATGSVQYGATSLGASTNSNTSTITSVDTSRAALFHLGVNATGGTSATSKYYHVTAVLTDATTVTVTRNDSLSSTTLSAGWVVVEFAAGVATVEHQTFTSTSAFTGESDLITGIDTARTMLAYGGERGDASTEQNFMHNLELTSSTGVTLTRRGTGTESRTLAYGTIQFAAGYVNRIQRDTTEIDGAATSADASITAVNTALALCNYLGVATAGDQPNEQDSTAKLLDTDTVRLQKGATGASSDDNDVGWEVVEFL